MSKVSYEKAAITVIGGTGAMGGFLAGPIALHDAANISLIGRDEQKIENIKLHGIAIRKPESPEPEVVTPDKFTLVSRNLNDVANGTQDYVIIAVKTYDFTPELARASKDLLKEGGAIVLAQNGLPFWFGNNQSKLKEALEGTSVISLVLNTAAEVLENEPGKSHTIDVKKRDKDITIPMGRKDNRKKPDVERLKEIFLLSHINTYIPRAIQEEIFLKLQINIALNTVGAILGESIGNTLLHSDGETVCYALAKDVNTAWRAFGGQENLKDRTKLKKRFNSNPQHYTSSTIDRINGRLIEDFITPLITAYNAHTEHNSMGSTRLETLEQMAKVMQSFNGNYQEDSTLQITLDDKLAELAADIREITEVDYMDTSAINPPIVTPSSHAEKIPLQRASSFEMEVHITKVLEKKFGFTPQITPLSTRTASPNSSPESSPQGGRSPIPDQKSSLTLPHQPTPIQRANSSEMEVRITKVLEERFGFTPQFMPPSTRTTSPNSSPELSSQGGRSPIPDQKSPLTQHRLAALLKDYEINFEIRPSPEGLSTQKNIMVFVECKKKAPTDQHEANLASLLKALQSKTCSISPLHLRPVSPTHRRSEHNSDYFKIELPNLNQVKSIVLSRELPQMGIKAKAEPTLKRAM